MEYCARLPLTAHDPLAPVPALVAGCHWKPVITLPVRNRVLGSWARGHVVATARTRTGKSDFMEAPEAGRSSATKSCAAVAGDRARAGVRPCCRAPRWRAEQIASGFDTFSR